MYNSYQYLKFCWCFFSSLFSPIHTPICSVLFTSFSPFTQSAVLAITLVFLRPLCFSFAFWLERQPPSESLPKVIQRSSLFSRFPSSPFLPTGIWYMVYVYRMLKANGRSLAHTIADINIKIPSQVALFFLSLCGEIERFHRGASGFQ